MTTKPMSARRRAKLHESVIRGMSKAVQERLLSDGTIDIWDRGRESWEGPEVIEECKAIWDAFLEWRRRKWPEVK